MFCFLHFLNLKQYILLYKFGAMQIKENVETQGDFVRSLIREVRRATYTNIEDVVSFFKWLADELSFLVRILYFDKHVWKLNPNGFSLSIVTST